MFAWFRYGAKEFPLVLMLANGLSNAMLPEFSTRERMRESLAKIRVKSKRLMHILFPLAMVMMIYLQMDLSKNVQSRFQKSADIFLDLFFAYYSKACFSTNVIVGRKKTHITLIAAILELAFNIPLSLLMIKWGYNL